MIYPDLALNLLQHKCKQTVGYLQHSMEHLNLAAWAVVLMSHAARAVADVSHFAGGRKLPCYLDMVVFMAFIAELCWSWQLCGSDADRNAVVLESLLC